LIRAKRIRWQPCAAVYSRRIHPYCARNVRLYGDDNPLDGWARLRRPKVKLLAEIDAYVRDKDPRVRRASIKQRRHLAGGGNPATQLSQPLSRHPPAGAVQYFRLLVVE
jgi:hypothetical protein